MRIGKAKEKVIVDLPFSTVVDFNKSNVSVPEDKKDCYFNEDYFLQILYYEFLSLSVF